MDWAAVADGLLTVALAAMFALCALGMLSMIVRGWFRGGRHRRHGMTWCMGDDAQDEPHTRESGLLDELRSERDRLNGLIARAERERWAQKDLREA